MSPTEIRIHWHTTPQITLNVILTRAVTAQELHLLADVVSTIEDFRADVQGAREVVE